MILVKWHIFIEIALQHDCSPVNLLYIFKTPFPKNTSGGLLHDFPQRTLSHIVVFQELSDVTQKETERQLY